MPQMFSLVRHLGESTTAVKLTVFIALLAVIALLANAAYYLKNKDRMAYKSMQRQMAARMLPFTHHDPQTQVVMPYRVFVPPNAGKKLPLILAMHSGRGRGNDNINQIDHTVEILLSATLQGIEPVAVLAPQTAADTHWVNYPNSAPPYLNFDQRAVPQSDNLSVAIKILHQVIGTYDIDPDRVYITGISMGGEGTWDALTYYPHLFAAAIVLNGAADPNALPRVGTLPIRFFHGSSDTITPVANSRALAQAFQHFDHQAQYQELDGAGHDIRDLVYSRGLFQWLLAQNVKQAHAEHQRHLSLQTAQ